MKKNKYIACSLFLGVGLTALNANVTATGSKTNFCENESVSVSYSGADPSSPGSSCCDGEGSWTEDGAATYSWSGDASGTSASATLNTSNVGSKTADVEVTQNWKCSEGSETDSTTASGSGSFTVNAGTAYEGANPCTPPTMPTTSNHSHPNISTSRTTRTYQSGSFPYRYTYAETIFAGTLSSVKHSIVPVAEGQVEKSGSCGTQIGTRNYEPGTWNVTVSVAYRGASVSGSWSGSRVSSTVFDGVDAQSESNKWKFGQVYKTNWRIDSGELTALKETTNTNTGVTTQQQLTNEPVSVSSGLEVQQYNYTVCSMCCSS